MGSIENREDTEWLNIWYSHANKTPDRYLLIGDSVTRALRSKIEGLLLRESVDLFAASFSFFDELFWQNLRCFLLCKDYVWNVIIINYGFHHGYFRLCSENFKYYCEFKDMYRKIVDICRSVCKDIVIMTGTSFSNFNNEKEIIARNTIVKEVALEKECLLFDMHELMERSNEKFLYVDSVHYEVKADFYMAYHVVNSLLLKRRGGVNDIRSCIFRQLNPMKPIVIYGMGNRGMQIHNILKCYAPEINICAWAITNKNSNVDLLFGIPVYDISQIKDKENTIIISSLKFWKEMYDTADSMGFKNIIQFNYEDWIR